MEVGSEKKKERGREENRMKREREPKNPRKR